MVIGYNVTILYTYLVYIREKKIMLEKDNTDLCLGDRTIKLLSDYVVLSEIDKRKALYYIAASHLKFEHRAKLLMILAPEGGCGKTRLKKLISYLVPDAKTSVDPSPAWVYTILTSGKKAGIVYDIFLDEMGKYYDGKRETSQMSAIICGGVEPEEYSTRVQFIGGERKDELLETYVPKVVIGIRN
jgi:hypothetical protein